MVNVKYPTDIIKKVESIFLAGTIDMGKSIDWQSLVIDELKNYDIIIYNPRRLEWDSSWEQSINNPQFNHQVTWELECLKKSDLIVMYLAENSQSIISMLELGLHLNNNRIVVYCPSGFHRKGNVDITCKMYNITVYDKFDDLLDDVKKRLEINI